MAVYASSMDFGAAVYAKISSMDFRAAVGVPIRGSVIEIDRIDKISKIISF